MLYTPERARWVEKRPRESVTITTRVESSVVRVSVTVASATARPDASSITRPVIRGRSCACAPPKPSARAATQIEAVVAMLRVERCVLKAIFRIEAQRRVFRSQVGTPEEPTQHSLPRDRREGQRSPAAPEIRHTRPSPPVAIA